MLTLIFFWMFLGASYYGYAQRNLPRAYRNKRQLTGYCVCTVLGPITWIARARFYIWDKYFTK